MWAWMREHCAKIYKNEEDSIPEGIKYIQNKLNKC